MGNFQTYPASQEKDETENDCEAIMFIPTIFVGQVIGWNEENLRNIEENFNVKISVRTRQAHSPITKLVILSKEGSPLFVDAIDWINSIVLRESGGIPAKVKYGRPQKIPRKFQCGICFEDGISAKDGLGCSDVFDCDLNFGTFDDNFGDNFGGLENNEFHVYCKECLGKHAEVLANPVCDVPLASGGVGLKCPEGDCGNVILMSDIRHFLSPRVLDLLEKRCIQDNVKESKIGNLSICHGCQDQMIVEGNRKHFECISCKRSQCRYCPREFNENHVGKKCAQLDREEEAERKRAIQRGEVHMIQDQMSEAMIRKCPKCKIPVTKRDGCNSMTCKCRTRFCFICMAVIKSSSHFGVLSGCGQFSNFDDMPANNSQVKKLEKQLRRIQNGHKKENEKEEKNVEEGNDWWTQSMNFISRHWS